MRAFNALSNKASFYPGIEESLKVLHEKNIPVVLVTSRKRISVEHIQKHSSISAYISGCIAYEDSVKHKPDPDPILKAMEIYSLEPEHSVYIGDTESDHLTSMASHIKFGLAGWNKDAHVSGKCVVYDTPYEFLNDVLRRNLRISRICMNGLNFMKQLKRIPRITFS